MTGSVLSTLDLSQEAALESTQTAILADIKHLAHLLPTLLHPSLSLTQHKDRHTNLEMIKSCSYTVHFGGPINLGHTCKAIIGDQQTEVTHTRTHTVKPVHTENMELSTSIAMIYKNELNTVYMQVSGWAGSIICLFYKCTL